MNKNTMKVLLCKEAGNLESIQIIEKPIPEPKDNEVQIAVKAVAISISDLSAFSEKIEKGKVSFAAKLLTENKPFGGDVSGIVTKVGKKVTSLKIGDEIYSSIGFNGGCAEYIVVHAKKVTLKPKNLSFVEACAIPTSGLVGLEACQKANIKPKSSVLVYGSSGGVGIFSLQIAKAMGGIVTAVCSTKNVENLYSLGADEVIDYTKTDITKMNKKFDSILGVNGNISLKDYKRMLKEDGTYVAVGGKSATSGLLGPIYSLGSSKHMTYVLYARAVQHGHLQTLKEMAEKGQIKPYIEKVFYPKDVRKEFERLCVNHAKGKNVIKIKFDE